MQRLCPTKDRRLRYAGRTDALMEETESSMPRISEFYGIVVFMLYADHNPPHFHARYGGCKHTVEIAWASAYVRHRASQ